MVVAFGFAFAAPGFAATSPSADGGQGTLSDAQVAQIKRAEDASAWDVAAVKPTLSQEQRDRYASKVAAMSRFFASPNSARVAARSMGVTVTSTSAVLDPNQAAQINSYFCGPAALFEALDQRGVYATQNSLGSQLHTTTDGTAWSGINATVSNPTGYPMPDVLNARLASAGQSWYYAPEPVSYSPTDSEIVDYRDRLKYNTSSGWPVVGNAWEVINGPHLAGHPVGREIHHWFDMRGYYLSGSTTYTFYEDTVHNASSISWSAGVPAYSDDTVSKITRIVGGRGYTW